MNDRCIDTTEFYQSTESNLRSTESNLRSTESNLRSTESNLRSTESNLRLTESNLRSTESNLWSTESNLRSTNDCPSVIEHGIYYDFTIIKSYIENYNENKLFEYLDTINVVSLKKIINSYLLIEYVNVNIISYQLGFSYNCFYDLVLDCDDKIYKFRCNHYSKSITSFSIHSTISIQGLNEGLIKGKQRQINKILMHWNSNESDYNSFQNWFNSIINNTPISTINRIRDVLFALDKINKLIIR